ncbi:uncharacterized protein LOC124881641 isoform X2 [Girardinichthys multiradiatus]|uniref:uncharacterized protein LOC124881641 isoform X2 n=1 Tax=Girardinichthys multiradiatus TaxID=208333 RepID=UPI001FABADAA|nr:uncharacterized protein LOC124881641 isoform X2 [Girardinichthys multiradiatus]XP_047243263.1 uncharacterized protein LOC124881641 isoform X2 [Girardinichthys multiradiatus]
MINSNRVSMQMAFNACFAVGALLTEAISKTCTCCFADNDLDENEQIIHDSTDNALRMQTYENVAFFSVPENETNLNVEVSSEDEQINTETTAKEQGNSGVTADGIVFTGSEEHVQDEIRAKDRSTMEDGSTIRKTENTKEMNDFGDTSCLVYPGLVQNETVTVDNTGTKYEQDSFQYEIITEEELSGLFENETPDDTDYFYRAEDGQSNFNLDPTLFFCKFSNSFNNCWMNATMQTILNLSITRKFVAQYPEEIFGSLSGTPLFASLLCKAMHHPGKYISQEEIYQVLMEISENVPSLHLAKQNDLLDFLKAILNWLNPSGINTSCVVFTAISCEECQKASYDFWEIGPILHLPHPLPYDSITSLLNRLVAEFCRDDCNFCYSILKRKHFLSYNDVITLWLPRPTNQGDLKHPVIPSTTIEIPVKNGTQLYHLSSIICHETLTDHFYTYLMCGQLVFKAEDDQVTISNTDCAADICLNGFIYVYEKYVEGQDEFSGGLKVTPEQENWNPQSSANIPTMARSGGNGKALTYPDPKLKEKSFSTILTS